MDKLLIILLLQSALFLQCVFSVSEFFPYYGINFRDNNISQPGRDDDSLTLPADLKLSCGAATILRVYVSGRATLIAADNSILMSLDVFEVDIREVDERRVYFRYLTASQERDEIVNCMRDFYTLYFPRENLVTAFEPESIIVVTWQIIQEIMSSSNGNSMNNDTFQMVIATQGNRSVIALFYHTIEWGQSTASVGIQTCTSGIWRPSGINAPGETVVASSNIPGRSGEWIFYVPQNGLVIPTVNCRVGCSLQNGYCTERDTCLCKENWSGNNCDVPVCPSGCVNGNCSSPQNCVCNPNWTGTSCNIAMCYDDCVNGGCNTPLNCTCRDGWIGQNCTDAVCDQDCGCFGFCTRPNHCSCIKGYGGSTCDPLCSSTCDDNCNNGNCTAPDTCTCASGWTGSCCNDTISITSSATPIPTGTDPTQGTSSSLSGTTIGAIAGSIAALVVIILVIAVIFIIALISC